MDIVDQELYPRYVQEANMILNRFISNCNITAVPSGISRLSAFDVFLPLSILEKLRSNVSTILRLRCRKLCTIIKLVWRLISQGTTFHVSFITLLFTLEFYLPVSLILSDLS